MSTPAVFLDRDGTLIEDRQYLRDPAAVSLLPGAAAAVARLNRAGLLAIVVTNQSGIARGLLTAADYLATEQRLDQLLAENGARLDAHYHCPHHPEVTGHCDCRKPAPLLYRQAAERFGIALGSSWWVGDRLRDIQAAETLGGRGILLLTGDGQKEARLPDAERFTVAADLSAAVDAIVAPNYLPRP